MNLDQAVKLINQKVSIFEDTHTWADLGCGTGLFTQALAQLLAEGSIIHAVDTNKDALLNLPQVNPIQINTHVFNFEEEAWPFRDLDGVLMANSLHYVEEKRHFLEQIQQYLQPSHNLLFIEYEMDSPNAWVPYPIRYAVLSQTLMELGYQVVSKLGERPSIFGRTQMYAALAQK